MVKINNLFQRRQIHGRYWIQIVYWSVFILLFNGNSQSHLSNYSLSRLSSNLLSQDTGFLKYHSKALSPSPKEFKIRVMLHT